MNDSFRPFAPRTLALLVAAAFAGHAQANTGRVEFVFGGATLRNTQGDRPLVRGTDLRSGDSVITTDGRAQIRFSDGAFVSLQPNTDFKIDEYKFDGQTDGSERGIFALAKGAMRTVTGLVGRVNRRSYEVRTPTATVGIRGTGGIISILLDGATLVRGTRGIWTLTNLGGLGIDVPAGRAGVAGTDQSQPPKETARGPSAPPAQQNTGSSDPPISKAEDRDKTGNTAGLDTGVTLGVVFNEVIFNAMNIGVFKSIDIDGLSVKGTIGANKELTGFAVTSSGSTFKLAFAGTLNEAGTDGGGPAGGGVSWGRWTGPVTATGTTTPPLNYGPNGGFHYAIGIPTAVMPTTGTFNYNLIGATAVTHQLETLSPGMVTSASFKGMFTPTGGKVGLDVFYTIAGSDWHLYTGSSGSSNPTVLISGNTFADSAWNKSVGGSCGPCSSSPCNGQIKGGFAGTGATYAGVAYKGQITNASNSNVGGILVFKK